MKRRPGNYAEQAKTYDRTRGASPTIVRTVGRYLGTPDGRSLMDIAGGTGNYGQVFQARGFRVVVLDVEFGMLRRAAEKLGPGRSVVGDAGRLPFSDRSCDCAIVINAIHLFEDVVAGLREARRVVRDGPVVFTAFTEENNSALFVHEYFGLEALPSSHMSSDQIVQAVKDAGFSAVEHEPFVYTDTVDGSLNALHTNALHLAGPAYLRNTSFWHELDDGTRRKGLAALAADLRSGALEYRVRESFRRAADVGHGTVFAARP
ncbi:MAG TPA: methyltransferase domain-containing protein [Actinomycetota bacterium]|nr:methyltransferase domain-containing protein [Actinomycetota bacterium]